MVHVVVTGKIIGLTQVVPYSHGQGLQFYVDSTFRTREPVIYQVPFYEVRIDGGSTYGAVRFGVQNKGQMPPEHSCICNAGLAAAQTCTPSWVPLYSPHSFNGTSRPGAWRLLPGQSFLIHEGANTMLNQVGGSLGCVEILDGKWNGFLNEIEKLGNQPCSVLGAKGGVKVTIELAARPIATLVPR